ncbi:unnamed protein product [Ectocarpus sp. 12 AP-2014]
MTRDWAISWGERLLYRRRRRQQQAVPATAGSYSSDHLPDVLVPFRRKWIATHGSGGPAWDKDCDPTLPEREHHREALFDYYEGHTKTCSTCLRALKNVNRLLAASKTATVVSFTWGLLRGARAVSTPVAVGSRSAGVINAATARAMLPAVVLTLASLGAVKALEKFRSLYYTYSFHHQDNP